MFGRRREIEELRTEIALLRNPPAPPPGGPVELMQAFIQGLHMRERLMSEQQPEETVVNVGGEEIRCRGNVTIQVIVENRNGESVRID